MKPNANHLITRLMSSSSLIKTIGSVSLFMGLSNSYAMDFGVYDARALGMGGSGVASATAQHAVFYNPALLALYDGEEEDTRNGRIYFPVVVAQINDAVEDALDILQDNLDDQFSSAIDAYNADSANAANISAVAATGQELLDGINQIGNRELESEAFLGFLVSEPSNREGGSFYFGSRAIAGGVSNVTPEDIELLQAYVDAFSTGDPLGAAAELFEDGVLVDPADQITSSANIGSLVITEWGVAVSKEFELWGLPVAFGATPKIMHVDIYRDDLSYSDSDYNFDEDRRSYVSFNSDLGVIVPLGDYFRVGLATKDILPQEYEGANDLSVKAEARTRFAAAFTSRWLNLALDVDLQEHESLAADRQGQDITMGGELTLIPWVHFRGGYRYDIKGSEEGETISAGVGFRVGRFVADGAYAVSDDTRAASFQLGWTF